MRTGKKLGDRWFGGLLSGRRKSPPKSEKPATRERGPQAVRRPAPSGRIEKPRTLRILILDDEVQVGVALKRLLHRHEVTLAHSGSEARVLIAEKAFDVVVSDVMMPEPSGIDVYMELLAQRSPLVQRFIFVTGGVSGTKAPKFLASISNPRLDKPVDSIELECAIARVLNGREGELSGAG